ncbi:MAG: nucleoside hydrolase [Pseudomonadota bacterium]
MRPLLIDTDPGIDDAMAIAFAACSPAVNLVALTTVAGNAPIATTTYNALSLATRFELDVPVARGASCAIDGVTATPPTFVHGDDGLGNTGPTPGKGALANQSAAELIVATARRYPQQLVIVALGQLSNLALALRLEPELPTLIADIVIMGGVFGFGGEAGNVTPLAEANAHGDPLAADLVFAASWPLTVVGLDVTMQTIMDDNARTAMRHASDSGAYLYEVSAFYDRFYRDRHGIDGFPVHDSSAIAYVLDPSLFKTCRGVMLAHSCGASRGQTVFVPDPSTHRYLPIASRPQHKACYDVRADDVLALFQETLKAP